MLTRKRRTRRALRTLLLFLSLAGFAPAQAADEDFHTWGAIVATGNNVAGIERLHGWLEGQGRFNDDTSRFNQGILRTALGWKIAPRTVLWAGYAWIPNDINNSGDDFDEHRWWQQLTWSTAAPVAGFSWSSRTRFEQRIFESSDDTALRFRQLLKATRPLSADGRLYFSLWDEVFVDLNDAERGVRTGLDQNRVFAGLGAQLAPKLKTEIGYMNQFVNRHGRANASNHILSLTLFVKF